MLQHNHRPPEARRTPLQTTLRRAAWLACALGAGLPGLAAAAAATGLWQGTVACSENRLSGSAAYQQNLSVLISGSGGSTTLEDAQTREQFAFRVTPDGTVSVASEGTWKNAPERRWSIRAEGAASGQTLRLHGQMLAGDGQTRVRDRCTIELSRLSSPNDGVAGRPSRSNESAFAIEHGSNADGRALETHAAAARYPGIAASFPEWLMPEGQPWAYRAAPSPQPRPLGSRPATTAERSLFDDAKRLVDARDIKAIAFIDGYRVVQVIGKPGLTPQTRLPSASISKTVTAVTLGRALCAQRLQLGDRIGTLITSLRGTPIGEATLRDALLMSSGSAVHGHSITAGETALHFNGTGSLENLLASPRFTQTVAAPGSSFVYKSVDPYLVSTALQQALGQPFTRFFSESVLAEVRNADPVVLDTDKAGNFLSTGGVRMSLADWIRFAIHVREQRAGSGCFAEYLQSMSRAQIRIAKIPGVNGFFNGYGFFTWVDNDAAPNTFWAVGHFGQRIGWSNDPANPRIFLTFGFESDADMSALYPLARRWINR